MNDYDVFYVTRRDPYELSLMGTYRAVSGHGAIQDCIAFENEENSPLAKCDFVAYAKWAAQKEHYPGYRAEMERLAPVAVAMTKDERDQS